MITEKIGELDVYGKGTLINTDNSLITLSLGNKAKFGVEFQFLSDSEKKDARVEYYKLENKIGIGLKVINFNNTLGSGNTAPLKIGWLEGRSLFISYRIFPINNNLGSIVHYQFLHGKNVDKDGQEI